MKLLDNAGTNPQWDSVGINRVDFQSVFGGDLVNVYTCIKPLESREETEKSVRGIFTEIVSALLNHDLKFEPNDRFQIIIGWDASVKESGREIVKYGGRREDLERYREVDHQMPFRRGWDSIFA